MSVYRYRRHFDVDYPASLTDGVLYLIGIGMAVAVMWGACAILKFMGWL